MGQRQQLQTGQLGWGFAMHVREIQTQNHWWRLAVPGAHSESTEMSLMLYQHWHDTGHNVDSVEVDKKDKGEKEMCIGNLGFGSIIHTKVDMW